MEPPAGFAHLVVAAAVAFVDFAAFVDTVGISLRPF